jgi:hypothetical protein
MEDSNIEKTPLNICYGVAICGPMCAGKTALANNISRKLADIGFKSGVFSFATSLKRIAKKIQQTDTKNRKLLQTLAEGIKDEFGSNIFALNILKQIKAASAKIAVIDDLRFNTELYELLNDTDRKWIIIRLKITKGLQKERLKQTYPDSYKKHIERLNHVSEQEFKKFNVDFDLLADVSLDVNSSKIIEYIL